MGPFGVVSVDELKKVECERGVLLYDDGRVVYLANGSGSGVF